MSETRSLKDNAVAYVPRRVGNIADLERISVDILVERKTYGTDEDAFTIDVISVDEKDYRLPVSVIAQLHALMVVESFEFFKVVKTGTTMKDTKYTVIPELE